MSNITRRYLLIFQSTILWRISFSVGVFVHPISYPIFLKFGAVVGSETRTVKYGFVCTGLDLLLGTKWYKTRKVEGLKNRKGAQFVFAYYVEETIYHWTKINISLYVYFLFTLLGVQLCVKEDL